MFDRISTVNYSDRTMPSPKDQAPEQFRFDPSDDINASIASFLEALRKKNTKLTGLLEQHIGTLLPLPLDPAARATARSKFNSAITKALEADD
jgi:hypothetical protein